jgi:hypothetical protein
MPKESKRSLVRQEAHTLLRSRADPLHYTEIASVVLVRLHLEASMSAKDVNTCLHDDPEHRFVRVKRGTWTCRGAGQLPTR